MLETPKTCGADDAKTRKMILMDNQQVVINDVEAFDLGWLVAAIEGEGSISLPGFRRKERKNSNIKKIIGIKPIITLSNTDEAFIDRARMIAQRYTSPGYKQALPSRKKGWSGSFRNVWEGCKRVKKLLDVVEPYLVVKKTNASIVREFCESRLSVPPKTEYSARELQLFMQARALHNRGTRDPKLHEIIAGYLRDLTPDDSGRR